MTAPQLLTGPGLVLAYYQQYPTATAREASDALGITERTVLECCRLLQEAGWMDFRRSGRRGIRTADPWVGKAAVMLYQRQQPAIK